MSYLCSMFFELGNIEHDFRKHKKSGILSPSKLPSCSIMYSQCVCVQSYDNNDEQGSVRGHLDVVTQSHA
jgi:hypothetical protein